MRTQAKVNRLLLLAVAMVVSMLAVSTTTTASATSTTDVEKGAKRVFDFEKGESPWVAINDGVMGGVSSGSVASVGGVMTFRGRVRLENNGGFASTRSNARSIPVTSTDQAFLVRVKGDGNTYQFTVDTTDGWYWTPLSPAKGSCTTLRIPFTSLQPRTRFGEVATRRAFDGSQKVTSVGLLVYNKRAERFTIGVDWIDLQ